MPLGGGLWSQEGPRERQLAALDLEAAGQWQELAAGGSHRRRLGHEPGSAMPCAPAVESLAPRALGRRPGAQASALGAGGDVLGAARGWRGLYDPDAWRDLESGLEMGGSGVRALGFHLKSEP